MRTRYVILIIVGLIIATILTQPKLTVTPPTSKSLGHEPATAKEQSSPEGDEKTNGLGTS